MAPLVRSKLLLGGILAAAALVLVPAGLAGNGGFAPPPADSPNAEGIRESYFWVAIFTGVVFVLVQGALLVFIVKYRRRGRPRDTDGPQVHGNTRLEITWTVVPVLILVAIGTFVFYKLPGIHDVPSATAAGGREDVAVVGQQFYWEFTYPNGAVAVDRMRVPVDRNMKLIVTAPDFDVIHSWWIPQLGGKIDAIPGRVNTTWFRAERAGIFQGQCAELCGILHARMAAEVEALPQAEYDRWVEARAKTTRCVRASPPRAPGRRSGAYESRSGASDEGARPSVTARAAKASFQPRFRASRMPVFMPCAAAGEWVCAASPTRKTRPTR